MGLRAIVRCIVVPFLGVLPGLMLAVAAHAQEPALAAGTRFSLGLHADGSIFAWGLNSSGQLGDGTTTSRLRPVRINGLNPASAVAAGSDHALALLADTTVWSWGQNNYGQLGNGGKTPRSKPGIVPGLDRVIAIAAGQGFSLALRDDHTLWAWGRNNFGQLGDGTKITRLTPVQVLLPNPPADFQGFVGITAGAFHGMAIDDMGRVYTWGDNFYGQLGLGNNEAVSVPTVVSNLEKTAQIQAGYAQSYAVTQSRFVASWGSNFSGQLGTFNIVSRNTPICISKGCQGAPDAAVMTQVATLYAGGNHVFAKDLIAGDIYWWGLNSMGQLGNNTQTFASVTLPTTNNAENQTILDQMVLFAGGDAHSLGLNAEGQVYAWGSNGDGQVGSNASDSFYKLPTPVLPLAGAGKLNLKTAVAAGSDTTPDTFVFPSVVATGLQTEIRSSEIIVSGIDAPADISVLGGEYVINPANPVNAASFGSTIGKVNAGDRVVVRHFSAASAGTSTTTTLTVGTLSVTFESTTASTQASPGGGCGVHPGQHDISPLLLLLAAMLWPRVRRSVTGKAQP